MAAADFERLDISESVEGLAEGTLAAFGDTVTFTIFQDARAADKEEVTLTLFELARRIHSVRADRKADLPWLKLARFGVQATSKKSLRHDANVLSISGVEVDYDGGVMTFEEATDRLLKHGIRSLIYTSPSHTVANPRWRVLCPSSTGVSPEMRTKLLGRLNGVLGGVASPESWTLSQSYFFGGVGAAHDHRVTLIDGRPIDLASELDEIWWGKSAGANRDARVPPDVGRTDEQALLASVASGASYHVALVRLIGKWAFQGISLLEARDRARAAMSVVPDGQRDTRWQQRHDDIERCLLDIYGKEVEQRFRTAQAERSAAVPPDAAKLARLPLYRLGEMLDDQGPMPHDLIGPRVLTPGGMLLLAGAPKVGKSDFLLQLLIHAAAGEAFLCFQVPRPLRVVYLQSEIHYHYLRERLQQSGLDSAVLAGARDNLRVSSSLRLILNGDGVELVTTAIMNAFVDTPPDIICVDPIRNVFDGGDSDGGENDNQSMMYFLQQRIDAVRYAVNPEAGLILVHHTRKTTKDQLKDDPFQALAGASALRAYYSTGILMHRPDDQRPESRLEFELRNGPPIPPATIAKRDGRYELAGASPPSSGRSTAAGRDLQRHEIVDRIAREALEGRVYTIQQFCVRFAGEGGLKGQSTIRAAINGLAGTGHVKFTREIPQLGLRRAKSTFGYLCVEGMQVAVAGKHTGSAEGSGQRTLASVLPSHYRCPTTGQARPVENPSVWVYRDPAK